MFTIENKYGNDGYAFWFKLLELLGSTEHHYIDCNNSETWEFMLAKTRLNEISATEILDLFSRLGAIDKELWEHKIIRSQNFIDNLNTVYVRREINVYTKSDILGLCIQKLPLNGESVNIYPQSKVKESKGEESIVMTSDESTFIKELEQIKNYPLDRKKDIEFYNTLQERYPTIDLILMIQDYAVYKIDHPIAEKDNPRSQINTQCKKCLEWKKCLKKQEKPVIKNKVIL